MQNNKYKGGVWIGCRGLIIMLDKEKFYDYEVFSYKFFSEKLEIDWDNCEAVEEYCQYKVVNGELK